MQSMFHLNLFLNVMDKTLKDIRSKIYGFEGTETAIHGAYFMVFLIIAFVACILSACGIENATKLINRMITSIVLLSIAVVPTVTLLLIALKRIRSLRYYALAVYDRFTFGTNAEVVDSSRNPNRMMLSSIAKVNDSIDSIYRDQGKLLHSIGSIGKYKAKKDQELSSMFYVLTRSMICPDYESLHRLVDVCNMDLAGLDLPEDVIKHLKKRSVRSVRDILYGKRSLLRYEELVNKALLKKHPAFELYLHYPELMKDVIKALSKTDSYIHELQLYPSQN